MVRVETKITRCLCSQEWPGNSWAAEFCPVDLPEACTRKLELSGTPFRIFSWPRRPATEPTCGFTPQTQFAVRQPFGRELHAQPVRLGAGVIADGPSHARHQPFA